MNKYSVKIQVAEGEIQKILDELTEAQDTIRRCYRKLEEIGVLTVTKEDEAASDN